MTMTRARTVMAFDYGSKRIGVAVGQTVSATAMPLEVLRATNGSPAWHDVARLIEAWTPDLLVVGMPHNDDDAPHRLEAAITRFSRRLRGRYQLPLEFVDERLSSYAASTVGGTRLREVDAMAAKMILETWLECSRSSSTASAR